VRLYRSPVLNKALIKWPLWQHLGSKESRQLDHFGCCLSVSEPVWILSKCVETRLQMSTCDCVRFVIRGAAYDAFKCTQIAMFYSMRIRDFKNCC
jgi:hypothetical protein